MDSIGSAEVRSDELGDEEEEGGHLDQVLEITSYLILGMIASVLGGSLLEGLAEKDYRPAGKGWRRSETGTEEESAGDNRCLLGRWLARAYGYRRGIKVLMLLVAVGIIIYECLLFRTQSADYQYELVPFWSYVAAWRGDTVYGDLWPEIFLNYLLYVPFGFMVRSVWLKISWWKVWLIGAVLASGVECTQLVTRLGLFEFDDIIGNSLGGLIGYWCHGICARVKRQIV